MPITLGFDVYGTLIDTQGVLVELEKMVGEGAGQFSQTWRQKQLEYSFRRGLMQNYADFSVCTQQALDYTCRTQQIDLSAGQKKQLLQSYQSLPAFDDVRPALTMLKKSNLRLFAFSNGSKKTVEGLLKSAGVFDFFDGVVSCDDLRSFKPNPAVYAHFLRESEARANEAWLISGNSFDVIGALCAGMRAAWVQRSAASEFDPWGIEPTLTVTSLAGLTKALT